MDNPALVACPRCQRHHFAAEVACPFCAAPASAKMAKAVMAALTPMVLAACYGVGKFDTAPLDSGDDTGDTGDSGDTDAGPPSVTTTWGAEALELSIEGGGGAWWFGMAQTDNGDGGTAGGLDWTGEDCVYGYERSDGQVLAYCHDGTDSGTTLAYGGDPNDLAAGTTVFDASFEGKIAYYLESDPAFGGDGSCWVWGAGAVDYYAGLGCEEL